MNELANILDLSPAETTVTMAQLHELQRMQQEIFDRRLNEFGKLLLALDEQNRKLQKLIDQRLTITSAQAKVLRAALIDRAKAICELHHLNYSACGGKIRTEIRKQLHADFRIADLTDLPAVHFESALECINEYSSFGLIQQLKRKV